MRLGDTVIGALVALIGAVLAIAAWSLPNLPNQAYGAATFPVAIGVGLVALGAVMAGRGLVGGGGLQVALVGWGRAPGAWLRLAATIALVLVTVVLTDKLGFLVTGTVVLFALLVTFRAPLVVAVPLAPVATYVVAWAFGNLLRVPLPRGVLSGLW